MLLAVALAVVGGCYQVPPELPAPGALAPLPAGWPPPAVHASDPLHPANRWFQRVWSVRCGDRQLGLSPADPLPPVGARSVADLAETEALLAALLAELPSAEDPVARLLLHVDLHAALGRVEMPSGPLARVYRDALSALPVAPVEMSGRLGPPSLRSGAWVEVVGPTEEGLRPRRFMSECRVSYCCVSSQR